MDKNELDLLLSRYRLTFNWGEPGKKWWLVGQLKGGTGLRRTEPQIALDLESARAAAVQYIRNMYQ